jgi:hypothetical protein
MRNYLPFWDLGLFSSVELHCAVALAKKCDGLARFKNMELHFTQGLRNGNP